MAVYIPLAAHEKQAMLLLQFENKMLTDSGVREAKTVLEMQERATTVALKEIVAENFTHIPLLFEKAPAKMIETWGRLICSLVSALDEPESIVDAFVSEMLKNTELKSVTKLKIFHSLYNTFSNDSHGRYAVFVGLVKLAAASNTVRMVSGQFEKALEWVKIWNVTASEAQALRLLMADSLESSGNATQAYAMFVKYLENVEEADVASEDASSVAVRAAKLAVALPGVLQCDHLLELPAVAALSSSNAGVYELLKLFVLGTVADYRTYAQANPDFASSLGLSADACEKKIRLLTLTTTASAQPVLSYAAIAEALQIDEAEVERWVVLAISTNILVARVDQLERTVTINHVTQHRVYGPEQWKDLSTRVHAWKDSIDALLENL